MGGFRSLVRCFLRGTEATRGDGSLERRFAISPFTRTTQSRDRIVILQIDGGLVFSSNSIGARIWQGLAEGKEQTSMVEEISREYGVPREEVEPDVAGFLAELEAQRLVTRGTQLR